MVARIARVREVRNEDEGAEGEHEWLVLRTGSPEAFHRPFESFVDFQP